MHFTTPAVPPKIDSESVSGVTPSEASLEAQVNPNNQSITYTFEYATSEAAIGTAVATKPTGGTLSGFGEQLTNAVLAGLKAGDIYYYRVVVENTTTKEVIDGQVQSFTPQGLPIVSTGEAQSVTRATANCRGRSTPRARKRPTTSPTSPRANTTPRRLTLTQRAEPRPRQVPARTSWPTRRARSRSANCSQTRRMTTRSSRQTSKARRHSASMVRLRPVRRRRRSRSRAGPGRVADRGDDHRLGRYPRTVDRRGARIRHNALQRHIASPPRSPRQPAPPWPSPRRSAPYSPTRPTTTAPSRSTRTAPNTAPSNPSQPPATPPPSRSLNTCVHPLHLDHGAQRHRSTRKTRRPPPRKPRSQRKRRARRRRQSEASTRPATTRKKK